jgi:hypothetical protein
MNGRNDKRSCRFLSMFQALVFDFCGHAAAYVPFLLVLLQNRPCLKVEGAIEAPKPFGYVFMYRAFRNPESFRRLADRRLLLNNKQRISCARSSMLPFNNTHPRISRRRPYPASDVTCVCGLIRGHSLFAAILERKNNGFRFFDKQKTAPASGAAFPGAIHLRAKCERLFGIYSTS